MSETRWTPGPWEAVLHDDPRGQPVPYYRGIIAMVENGDRYLAVVLGDGNRRESVVRDEWEPNARLIAAAPALYEALALAYEAMNHMGDVLNDMDAVEPEDEEKTTPAFDAVRSALALARGEQP